jgi:nucleoside-diphosphate-sugar epimerase
LDILVVGGNGFIGSNLLSYLLNRDPNISIINLDVVRDTRVEEVLGPVSYTHLTLPTTPYV